MTAQPATVLGLRDRGQLKAEYHADIVVFDPATIQDRATYAAPHQYATGVSHVLVNGVEVLRDGEPTDARPGRVVRGRGWTGWENGGCRGSAAQWDWPFWGPADWGGAAKAQDNALDSN
jgi:N-acyl-D-amino-acid deacylase